MKTPMTQGIATVLVLCAMFLAGCTTQRPQQHTVLDGLLLYYAFDKDSDGTVVDLSGNCNTGTMKGAKFISEGRVGGACVVGAKVGYIEVPDKNDWSFGSNPFSITMWFKANAAIEHGEHMFVGHDEGGGARNKWAFEVLQGSLGFHINGSTIRSQRIAFHRWIPEQDKWHHIAMTRDGNTYKTYVDGVCVESVINDAPIPSIKAPLTIGQAEGLFVEGSVDEVMVFKRALTDLDVKKLFYSVQ